MTSPLLSIHTLSKSFEQNGKCVAVLKGVSFTVNAGEALAIMGPSGSGKSTLLHLMGGLDRPSAGEVSWQGKNIDRLSKNERARWRNRHLGFVFQFHHLLGEFSALENASLPLLIQGEKNKLALQRARTLLEAFGLGERLDHRPSELSGGERQRVAIARALACNPELLLADEPTGSLDHEQGELLIEHLLAAQRSRQMTLVLVTHNAAIAQKMDRILYLNDGVIDRNE